jgi:hypothetical protein
MQFLNKNVFSFLVLIFIIVFLMPKAGVAYVGPGLGLGPVGVILGLIAAVFMALFAVIWYPIKRLVKKKRNPRNQDAK